METIYLQDPSQCGNVLKGFEGFLSSSKSTALYVEAKISFSLSLSTPPPPRAQWFPFMIGISSFIFLLKQYAGFKRVVSSLLHTSILGIINNILG